MSPSRWPLGTNRHGALDFPDMGQPSHRAHFARLSAWTGRSSHHSHHERAHTVLQLQGHLGGAPGIPADGDPSMTRDEAMANADCQEGLVAALRYPPN